MKFLIVIILCFFTQNLFASTNIFDSEEVESDSGKITCKQYRCTNGKIQGNLSSGKVGSIIYSNKLPDCGDMNTSSVKTITIDNKKYVINTCMLPAGVASNGYYDPNCGEDFPYFLIYELKNSNKNLKYEYSLLYNPIFLPRAEDEVGGSTIYTIKAKGNYVTFEVQPNTQYGGQFVTLYITIKQHNSQWYLHKISGVDLSDDSDQEKGIYKYKDIIFYSSKRKNNDLLEEMNIIDWKDEYNLTSILHTYDPCKHMLGN